jgi:hypothetical protein
MSGVMSLIPRAIRPSWLRGSRRIIARTMAEPAKAVTTQTAVAMAIARMANQGGRICMILIAEQIAPPLESKNGFEVFFAREISSTRNPALYVAAF